MIFNTCPIAYVQAPLKPVWALLAEPTRCSKWGDAETQAIEPAGPAHPGQTIRAAGLPFRIAAHNHITVAPAASGIRVLEHVTAQAIYGGVAQALERLKCAAKEAE